MGNTKKIFIWIFIIIVVAASVYGGFYVMKLVSQQGSQEMPTGYERDMTKAVPSVIPEGLIVDTDIERVIESFNIRQEDGKTQYTFRYVSNKSYAENVDYYSVKFARGYEGWNMTEMGGNKTDLYSIQLIKYIGEAKGSMSVLVTRAVNDEIVVDITVTQ